MNVSQRKRLREGQRNIFQVSVDFLNLIINLFQISVLIITHSYMSKENNTIIFSFLVVVEQNVQQISQIEDDPNLKSWIFHESIYTFSRRIKIPI